jgi:hypothetical protein
MLKEKMKAGALPLLISVFVSSCQPAMEQVGDPMEEISIAYVKLVLAMGQHDADYVDAYLGPEEWKTEAASKAISVAEIRTRAIALEAQLASTASPSDNLEIARKNHLGKSIQSLIARADILSGESLSFDEESLALYDAVSPSNPEEYYQAVLDKLEAALPGDGSIFERYERFKADFIIPLDKLDEVFKTAIAACRERTARWIDLPTEESFEIEYVTDKSWSGYNWYKGDYHSLIQVNTDLPIYIDRAIDLACHEGYPGHHVYNVLLERELVRGRSWTEFTVYPLFSPRSLIAEGSANYGIKVAFPGQERIEFERSVLFPLAGLDPARAETYYDLSELSERLEYAGNEAARRYLDGEIDQNEAAAWLSAFAMMSPERAAQRVRFIDQYRSYVINYNLGQDLVKDYIEGRGGTAENPEQRWEEFVALLSIPMLPSELK